MGGVAPFPADPGLCYHGAMLATVRSLYLCWRLLREPRVSPLAKLIPLAALAYAISPVDFLSDWALPGVGLLDDVTVVLVAVRLFLAITPRRIILDHYYWMNQPRKAARRKREEPSCRSLH